jgi:hypothetical protein
LVDTPADVTYDTEAGAVADRAQQMVQRGRFATKVAIVFTLAILIVLPLAIGMPSIALVGGLMLAVLLRRPVDRLSVVPANASNA